MIMKNVVTATDEMKLTSSVCRSDPVSYTCTCGHPGSVLLFYRYFANEPRLPGLAPQQALDPEQQADFQRNVCGINGLTGKIRVSKEGFNVTVAGSYEGISAYIAACMDHWSFSGLDLEGNKKKQEAFFKPTPGCSCVFTTLSIRTTSEITPLGVTNYSPSTWSAVQPLSPAEFHQKCLEEDVKLIDVRNHYESKIGYFVSPKGGEAIKPPVRRFSQFPQWVKEHGSDIGGDGDEKPLLTYCTGGIRCEKGVRWMEEHISRSSPRQRSRPIHTLDGGISSYISWMESEIAEGRKSPEDSLFKGQNYVFDARGSMGIEGTEPVSKCHCCGVKTARLGKCGTQGCHLVLVVCEGCERGGVDVRCCGDCLELSVKNGDKMRGGQKRMCQCEQERERELWGGERVKEVTTQGWRKKKKMGHTTVRTEMAQKENIRVKVKIVAG